MDSKQEGSKAAIRRGRESGTIFRNGSRNGGTEETLREGAAGGVGGTPPVTVSEAFNLRQGDQWEGRAAGIGTSLELSAHLTEFSETYWVPVPDISFVGPDPGPLQYLEWKSTRGKHHLRFPPSFSRFPPILPPLPLLLSPARAGQRRVILASVADVLPQG